MILPLARLTLCWRGSMTSAGRSHDRAARGRASSWASKGQPRAVSCGLKRRARERVEPYEVGRNPAAAMGLRLFLRRGRDLNPRRTQRPVTVFETAAFDRSATPPRSHAAPTEKE